MGGPTAEQRRPGGAKAASQARKRCQPYTCPAPSLRQAGKAGAADGTAIGEVEFLGGEGHLGDGEIAAVGIGVPGILQGV